jgi:hypothetical protein
MECQKLKDDLNELVIEEFLKPENVTSYYLDSIAFGSAKLKDSCEMMIYLEFEKIM